MHTCSQNSPRYVSGSISPCHAMPCMSPSFFFFFFFFNIIDLDKTAPFNFLLAKEFPEKGRARGRGSRKCLN